MPVPSWARERASSTRWKRSKSRSWSLRAIPMPVSATTSRAQSPSASTVTAIPPSKVNLRALERRLSTTLAHISRSRSTSAGSGGESMVRVRPARVTAVSNMAASFAV